MRYTEERFMIGNEVALNIRRISNLHFAEIAKICEFFYYGVIGDRQDRKILENWHTKKVQLMIKS